MCLSKCFPSTGTPIVDDSSGTLLVHVSSSDMHIPDLPIRAKCNPLSNTLFQFSFKKGCADEFLKFVLLKRCYCQIEAVEIPIYGLRHWPPSNAILDAGKRRQTKGNQQTIDGIDITVHPLTKCPDVCTVHSNDTIRRRITYNSSVSGAIPSGDRL